MSQSFYLLNWIWYYLCHLRKFSWKLKILWLLINCIKISFGIQKLLRRLKYYVFCMIWQMSSTRIEFVVKFNLLKPQFIQLFFGFIPRSHSNVSISSLLFSIDANLFQTFSVLSSFIHLQNYNLSFSR